MEKSWGFCVLFVVLGVLVPSSLCISCYQCSGTDMNDPFQCNEWLNNDVDIDPQPCDNVYGASYCVKHIGRFEGPAIKCYQCEAAQTVNCSEAVINMDGMLPKSCDHVFEARYCVKAISLNGGIGAKRFCSSLDLGNYCNYVRQPGDELTYRTCVFTCTGDGCNPGNVNVPQSVISLSAATALVLAVRNIIVR